MRNRISFADALAIYILGKSTTIAQALSQLFKSGSLALSRAQSVLLPYVTWERLFDVLTLDPHPSQLYLMKMPPNAETLLIYMDFQTAEHDFLESKGCGKVETCLQVLESPNGYHQQGTSNIRAETRFLGITWWDIFQTLITTRADIASITTAITLVFRRYVLHGPSLPTTHDAVLGRVVAYDRLENDVSEQFGGGSRPFASHIRAAHNRWKSRKPWKVPPAWEHLNLSMWPMWSLFAHPDARRDPFSDLPSAQDDLICCLGIEKSTPKHGWIKLRFQLPPDFAMRFPTVADAYATGLCSFQFRPANPLAPFGLTLPLQRCAGKLSGSPECIHAEIPFSCLSSPPEHLK